MHVVHVVHVAGLVHSCSAAPWCLRADYGSQAEQVRAKRVQPMDARIVWQVDKLFMGAAQTVGGVGGQEQREHTAQLLLQTGPVSTRKHFYKTEVYQVQDVLLAETKDVNAAVVLGAAAAIMQSTGARCGMLRRRMPTTTSRCAGWMKVRYACAM